MKLEGVLSADATLCEAMIRLICGGLVATLKIDPANAPVSEILENSLYRILVFGVIAGPAFYLLGLRGSKILLIMTD